MFVNLIGFCFHILNYANVNVFYIILKGSFNYLFH